MADKQFIIAVDLDGMLFAFPHFFQRFFAAMQAGGCKVGILTGRGQDEKEQLIAVLKKIGIAPDFFVAKPDDFAGDSGVFKALVCKELNVDLLFDDFQTSDPAMIGSFFSVNQKTIPFTSWAYNPDQDDKINTTE